MFCFSVKDWLALIPPTLLIGGVSYYSYYSYQVIKKVRNGMAPINPSIRKDQPKVVDFIDIEDINGKQALCRCWKSGNVSSLDFPNELREFSPFDLWLGSIWQWDWRSLVQTNSLFWLQTHFNPVIVFHPASPWLQAFFLEWLKLLCSCFYTNDCSHTPKVVYAQTI